MLHILVLHIPLAGLNRLVFGMDLALALNLADVVFSPMGLDRVLVSDSLRFLFEVSFPHLLGFCIFY
ncbi:MAG: hypothetical protein ACW98I_11490 [Candidatus Hodarchaeales archaeon]|jgi:hypothetical protein